ncbi:PDxFFG protein [Mycoplasmopsis felis]|uniref:PDxFFG protein n=2 Tax=Mycoplasmopsis felis TaxID=33923 RepID=UPI002B003D99|nr:PDxFFG protein [Mycoplasmopsis felis]WQQ09532.1 PDxFFG protein [Mycoplasmopsis felis]
MKKKLSLKAKILLSISILTAGSSIAIGSMFAYANNSDEVNGSYLKINENEFKNDYSKIYDDSRTLIPEISILDPLKKIQVATISDSDFSQYSFAGESEVYNFDNFFKEYFNRYNESFILEVKYGSFSFYDEYVLAVKPKQFINFTKWFIENVAWGPDLLTLDSFRIVPGVEQNGNAITLGAHSTVHKEVSEIKFFPDAFFGSMPIYSILSGSGNSDDSLTYSLFKTVQNKDTIEDFLKSIPLASSLKNSLAIEHNNAFWSLSIPSRIIGKHFKIYPSVGNNIRRGEGTIIFDNSLTKEEFDKYKVSHNLDSKLNYEDLIDTEVLSVVSDVNDSNPFLEIEFNHKINNKNFKFTMNQGNIDETWDISYNTLKKVIDNSIEHFLDFYDVKAYENKTIWQYQNKNGVVSYYRSKVEALNKEKELINWANLDSEQQNKLKKLQVVNLDVIDKSLNITFTDENQNNQTITFNSQNMTKQEQESFNKFKIAVGYGGGINPIALSAGPEDISILDDNGKPLRGLASRKYQVYNESYTGLIDKVIEKYPHLLKKQNGPHIVKTLNDQGYYEYSLSEGEYYGLSENDRIGLPLLMGASLDNFDGVSADFLKYVAAHEYGHHFTLDQSQALNQDNNAIIVGGLSTRGGINESSYYSAKALRNYLYARTNLDFVRVNALGTENENTRKNGSFIKFLFKDKTTGEFIKELDDDIWGNAFKSNDIFEVLDNPKRRFLQTFEGLENAAKLRNVKLGDLFIANSFDENSGTLNPFINGRAKSFEKKLIDGKEVFVFKEVSAQDIVNQLKDGLGNSIDKAIEIVDEQTIRISVVQTVQEGEITKATKINLFNKDGSPAINVPLNEPLDQASIDYINSQTNLITRAIENIIQTNYNESGWNEQGTFLGGDISLGWNSLLNSSSTNGIKNNLLNRNNPNEINISHNEINNPNNPRTSFEYTALSKNVSLEQSLRELANAVIAVSRSQNQVGWRQASQAQVGTVFAFVDNNQIQSKYTFPYANDSYLLNEMYLRFQEFYNILERLNLSNIYGMMQLHPGFGLLLRGSGILMSDPSQINPILSFLDSSNNIVSPTRLQNAVLNRTNEFTVAELTQKITLNNINGRANGSLSLYSAYNSTIRSQINQGSQTAYAPVFDNFEAFLDFTSIDYSKAKLVKSTYKDNKANGEFNWDIDYVKSKFDFELFKNAVLTSDESKDIKEFVKKASEQNIANELMYRFRHSNHFFTVKDFNPIKDLQANQAIFSSRYGINVINPNFTEGFVYDLNDIGDLDPRTFFDANKLQEKIKEYVVNLVGQEKSQETFETLNSQDLYRIMGNILTWNNQGKVNQARFDYILYPTFSNGKPSSDVINYNLTRVEALLNDKFTDYIYNIAETLTRDFVQTTYVPETKDFENLPSYFTGISEAHTGLDYVIDATQLSFWNNNLNNQNNMNLGVVQAVRSQKFNNYYDKIKQTHFISSNLIKQERELERSIRKLLNESNKRLESLLEQYRTTTNQKTKEELNKEIQTQRAIVKTYEKNVLDIRAKISDITNDKFKAVGETSSKELGIFNQRNRDIIANQEIRNSSYFGNFMTRNNGYFKDRFQKEKIGMHLYDDQGKEVIDNEIRLKDFDGNQITSRPRAFFISQLMNYGVGNRTISGIFRNKRLDALALYGYVKNSDAKLIKKIRFIDVHTNEVKYLPVNFKDTNNIFYLKQQGIKESKVSIEDEGYTSWISDFGLMAKYRNTLLLPKHEYYLEFVDENDNVVSEVELGNLDFIAENGKTGTQASVKIYKNKNQDTNNKYKSIINIDYQFNISG